jgi:hypothetical protein
MPQSPFGQQPGAGFKLGPETQHVLDTAIAGIFSQLMAALLAMLFHPAPTPPPPPPDPATPPPSAPPITPAPPAPPPPAPPAPPAPVEVPTPAGIKLGWRGTRKLELGFRNEFNITPTDDNGRGLPEAMGEALMLKFGWPEAFQDGPGFTGEPVERASGDSFGCIARIATNSPGEWDGGRYTKAGHYTIGASYPHFNYWRCQDFTIGDDGQVSGAGTNQQSYNRPKA